MINISSTSNISSKQSDQAFGRILILSTAYLPLIGGAEIAFKEITDRIKDLPAGPLRPPSVEAGSEASEAGYQFDLITARFFKKNPKKEKIGNIAVYRVGSGTKFDKYFLPILGYLKAKKLFKENKYSLIWSISASQAGLAALFLKLKNPKTPFLLTVQEGSSKQRIFRRRWIVWPLIKKIFKKANYIQAISRHLAHFSKDMGAKCPIEVVPNGVDIEKFKSQIPALPAMSADRQAGRSNLKPNLRKSLGIKENEKVIITVSRLVPKNGVEDLIKSLKYIDFPAKLLILGVGPLSGKLKKIAKKLNLADNILFLGLIPPAEVPEYLAIADVFVRPAISEGFGNVFVEAMAAGVPIIGTPVGGILDFLEDPSTGSGQATGLFCEVNNPESIAQAIREIFDNKELTQRLIDNGQKLAEEKYSWNIIAKQMNKIFNKTCLPAGR